VDDQLLLQKEIFGHDGAAATGFDHLCQCSKQVKQ
jgi:hypothetical protein